MAEGSNDGPLAPRRNLGGPILPPPPPELAEAARTAEADKASAERADSQKQIAREVLAAQRATAKQEQQAQKQAQKRPRKQSREPAVKPARGSDQEVSQEPKRDSTVTVRAASRKGSARRTRRAQLRLVQVDAWSVMKTAFLLSIALGIVLVVAVAIIWSVLGAAGVWDSINSIVQQAVGSTSGAPFEIQQYLGTSRVMGFTLIVAVIDVILVTAIATLGAFLYNLSAALLGGIEVTLAEDS